MKKRKRTTPKTTLHEVALRELAFWRWVCLNGYQDIAPKDFPEFQKKVLLGAILKTGWSLESFSGTSLFELGCGPLGFVEFLPAKERVAIDPLNDYYNILFSNVRDKNIKYFSEFLTHEASLQESFDCGICFNVLDHTDNAFLWFNRFFNFIKPAGRFIFQVNTVRDEYPLNKEHKKMHPSSIRACEIRSWLQSISEFSDFEENTPSLDNEFYFMAWGHKK